MARSKTDDSKGKESSKAAKAVRKSSAKARPARPAAPKAAKPLKKKTAVKSGARVTKSAARVTKPAARDAEPKKTKASGSRAKTTETPRTSRIRSEKAPAPPPVRKSEPAKKRAEPPKAPRVERAKKAAAPEPPKEKEVETAIELDALSDEERIESAKYLPRDLPPRLFEEERFIFPESYGVNRLRLVPRDPQWLFAHWDVDSRSLGDLRNEIGERAVAVSRLTLRISDPDAGGTKVIHVPEGSRSWYVRADSIPRAYRAELGFTLPSGEFRKVAESSTVKTPWSGPSKQTAKGRVRYDQVAPVSSSAASPEPPAWEGDASAIVIDPGPWEPEAVAERPAGKTAHEKPRSKGGELPDRGGASDTYRR